MNKLVNLIRNNKTKFILFAMAILIASITLVTALLSSNLNINGTAYIEESSWVIYFTDVRKSTDSVASDNDARIVNYEKTKIEFSADLHRGGDFYEFTVYTVNDGSIDAMVDSIEKSALTEEQLKYLEFNVTYDDGRQIQRCDPLDAGTRRRVKAIVKYKDGIDMSDYPDEDVHLDLFFNINYVQKDNACTPQDFGDEHVLTIVPNGGIYQGRTDEIRVYLEEGDTYTFTEPTREFYNFTGWEGDPAEGTYTLEDKVFTMGKENVTMTASWEEGDYVARIMNVYYPSIQLAFDAAGNTWEDNTVYLLKDTTEDPTNNTDESFVFNLGGHTVTGTLTNSVDGNLTIVNGRFENEDENEITVRNYGILTMGVDDDDVQVESSIAICGETIGLQNEAGSEFYFYDGYLQAVHALVGGYTDKADGYYVIVDYRKSINKDRVYLVKNNNRAVAKTTTNGDLYYYNLQSAIEEVEGNKKDNPSLTDSDYIITAIRSFEAAYEIDVHNNSRIFFDTDGYNIDFGENITNDGYFNIYNGQDSISTLKMAKTIANNGSLIINNLLFEETTNSNIINNTGTLAITNSTLHSKYGNAVNNSANGTVSLDNNTSLKSDDGYGLNNSGSNLTIGAGTIYGFSNSGTATITGGNYITFVDKTQNEYNTRYTNGIYNTGTINMNGGSVQNNISTNPIVNRGTFNYYDGDLDSSTTLIENYYGTVNILDNEISTTGTAINNGTVNINGGDLISDTTTITGSTNVTVTSGEVKSNEGTAISISGSVNVNGGTVTGKTQAISTNNFTISSGTVTSEGAGVSASSSNVSGGTITSSGVGLSTTNLSMTGGTITSTDNTGVYVSNDGTITGGNINGDLYGLYTNNKITLGSNDENISTDSPVITGNSYGLYMNGNDNNFYDGFIKGQVDSYEGEFTGLPLGGFVAREEQTISDTNYVVSYVSFYENWLRVGENEYNTIDAASDAITGESGTIEVIKDAEINFEQTFKANSTKVITFDLNGHNITTTQNITNSSLVNLTITDSGNVAFNAKTGFINNGNVTFEGGTYTSTNPYIVTNNNVVTIDGATFTTNRDVINNGSRTLIINSGTLNGSTVVSNSYGSVTMNGGTINATNYGIINGSFEMNGGTINSNDYGTAYTTVHIIDGTIHTTNTAIFSYGTSTNIEGGTITSDNSTAVDGRRYVSISGGTITGTIGVYHTTYSDGYYIYQDNMSITGGTITGTTGEGIITYCGTLTYSDATTTGNTNGLVVSYDTNNYGATAVILFGTIKGNTNGILNNDTLVLGTNDETISKTIPLIMGGDYGVYNNDNRNATFRFFDGILKGLEDGHYGLVTEIPDASMVVDDYEFIDRVEYQTEYIGEQADWIRVGTRTFNSINKAADYIGESGTMYLMHDVSISFDQELPTGKDITFDLQGHSLMMTNSLKVSGTGTIIDSVGNGGITNIKQNVFNVTGNLIVNSGTYTATNTNTISNSGTTTINGGTIRSTKDGALGIYTTGTTNVTGGSIDAPRGIENNGGTLNVSGGTVSGTNGIAITTNATTSISGSAYVVSSTTDGVYVSNGETTISGGTIKSLGGTAIHQNDYYNSTLNVTGGEIEGNYNGITSGTGTTNISGGHIVGITNVGINAGGTNYITGGTIEGATYGVYSNGTTTLGNNDGTISIDEPSIKGELYGLYIYSGTVNFYDGILKGITDAYKNEITNIPDRTEIFNDVERIDNYDYKTAYLLTESVIAINTTTNEEYTNLQDALDEAKTGETVKLLANVPLYYEVINNNDDPIILDMNGFRITTNKRIINNKNLTIKNDGENDSFIRTSSGINLITNTETLNVYNVEIINNSSSVYVINNTGTLSLTESKVTGINDISSSNSVTLDHSIISSSNIAINTSGSLNVTGGSISGSYYSVYANNNKTNTLSECTITGTYYNQGGNSTTFNYVTMNSSIQNYSSTITANGSVFNYSILNAGTFTLQNNSTLNGVISQNSGTLSAINSTINSSSDRVIYNSGTMNINNTNVNVDRDYGDSRIFNNNGTLNITNGSTISGGASTTGASYMGIYSYGSGNATIEDSNIILNSRSNVYGVYVDSTNSHVTIKTGNIEVTGSTSYGAYLSAGTFTMGEVEVGEHSGTEDADVSQTNPKVQSIGRAQGIGVKHNNANFEFYDGIVWGSKYSKPDITTLVELNYEVTTYVDMDNGYEYSVLEFMKHDYQDSVAILNNVYYRDVQSAIDKCESPNDEILLLRSTSENTLNIPEGASVKINLNGYSITTKVTNNGTFNIYNGSLQSFDEVTVTNNGTLIIGKNDGTISSTNVRIISESTAIQNNGTVKMYDGYIQGVPSINGTIDEIPNLSRIYTEVTDQMERKYLQSLSEEAIISGETKLIITIDPNGGSYNGSKEVQDVYENYHVPYTLSTPIKNGCTFIGWEISDPSVLSGTGTEQDPYVITLELSDITLKAKWSINDDVVAQIGNEYYTTVMSAIEDAKDNDTITILKDVTEDVTNNKNVTIDLNNNTITGAFINNGILRLINGVIENANGTGLVNNKTLTMGERDGVVVTDSVKIMGTTLGLEQNGSFNFYDGYIEGDVAMLGRTNSVPNGYFLYNERNVIKNCQRVYLIGNPANAVAVIEEGGTQYFFSLQDAINTATVSGSEIFIVRDFEATYTITVDEGADILINMNSYNITTGNDITNNGTLKIYDNSENKGSITSARTITNNGTLTIEDISITESNTDNIAINSVANSSLNIKNANITAQNGYAVKSLGNLKLEGDYNLDSNDYALYAGGTTEDITTGNIAGMELYSDLNIGGTVNVISKTAAIAIRQPVNLTIDGGYYKTINSNSGIYNEGGSSTITMNSGTIEAYYGFSCSSGTTTYTLNGGTITASDQGARMYSDNCNLTVNDGSITGTNYGVYTYGQSNKININGGTITATSYDGIRDDRSKNTTSSDGEYPYFSKINVLGGTVTGARYGIYEIYSRTTIGNAEVKTTSTSNSYYAIYNGDWSNLYINDGAFVNAPYACGIYCSGGVDILGGRVVTGHNNGYGIYSNFMGLNMSGGSIEATGNSSYGIYSNSNYFKMNMTGGSITSKNIGVALVNSGNYTREFTMTGGSIQGDTYGVYQTQNFTTTIGNAEDELSTTIPYITGGLYGYYKTAGTAYFYNGRLRGLTYGYNDIFNNIRTKMDIAEVTETSDIDQNIKTYSVSEYSSTPESNTPKAGAGYAKITYLDDSGSVYTQNQQFDYPYMGSEDTFIPLDSGRYSIEVWGAQGGTYDSTYYGGYGGYSYGEIELSAGETLYINVGGQGSYTGSIVDGGYNGGGSGRYRGGSGGGATSIATASGLLSELENNKASILIVAGGGGGGAYTNSANGSAGGSGGGFEGADSIINARGDNVPNGFGKGGTQDHAGCASNSKNYCGAFGQGGTSTMDTSYYGSGGGGGGYYGGGTGYYDGGAGGSGYNGNSRLTNKVMYGYSVPMTNDVWINNYLVERAGFIEVNGETFNSFDDASEYIIDNLNGVGTMNIVKDATVQEVSTISGTTITLDLQGHVLTTTKTINNEADLTVEDGSTLKTGKIEDNKDNAFTNKGSITLDGVYVKSTGYNVINGSTGTGSIVLKNGSTLEGARGILLNAAQSVTMSDTTIIATTDAIRSDAAATVTINSGTITSSDVGIRLQTDNNTLTINDITLTGTNYGVYNYGQSSVITINDGTITANNYDGVRDDRSKSTTTSNNEHIYFSKININGGTVTAGRYAVYDIYSYVNVSNAELKSTSTSYAVYNYDWGIFSLNDGAFINSPNGDGVFLNSSIYIHDGSRIYAGHTSAYGIGGYYINVVMDGGSIETPGSNAYGIRDTQYECNINISGGSITSGNIGVGLNNSGNYTRQFTMTGGSIQGDTYGVYQTQNYATTIGSEEAELSTTIPYITGGLYGYYKTAGTSNFYNGRLRGSTFGYNDEFNNIRTKKTIVTEYESGTIDSTLTYSTDQVSEYPISNYAKAENGYVKLTYLGETVGTCTNNQVYEFDYTGEEETFTVECPGDYKIETWGAQGGSYSETYRGGYGAYSTGTISLVLDEVLYINVGEQGYHCEVNSGRCEGTYNGGGVAIAGNQDSSTGGGATSIALSSGTLYELGQNSLQSDVIIVAAGGGGTGQTGYGGEGGGLLGSSGTASNLDYNHLYGGTGASQTTGGTRESGGLCGSSGLNSTGQFGLGGASADSSCGGSGGGGGYYGGGGSLRQHNGAGGGSSYIGHSRLSDAVMYGYKVQSSAGVWVNNYLGDMEGFLQVGSEVFNSFEDANAYIVENLSGTGTINVIKDATITESITFPESTNITVDLKGHKLITSNTIINNSSLVIQDTVGNGVIHNKKGDTIQNNLNLTVDGAKLKTSADAVIWAKTGTGVLLIKGNSVLEGSRAIVLDSAQKLTVSDTYMHTTSDAIRSNVANANITINSGTNIDAGDLGIRLQNSGNTLVVNGGTIKGTNYGIYSYGATNTITINDGIITGTNNDGIREDYTSSGGTLSVLGGTVTGGRYGIYCYGELLTVENAEVKTTSANRDHYAIYTSWGTTHINDGAFINAPDASGIWAEDDLYIEAGSRIFAGNRSAYGIAERWSNTFVINGGTIETPGYNAMGIYSYDNLVNLTMNSGTITSGHIGLYLNTSSNYTRVVNIYGGSISGETYGIYQPQNYTTTIGDNESELSTTVPYITGGLYGIYNTAGTVNLYSGRLRGQTYGYYNAINDIREEKVIKEEIEGNEDIGVTSTYSVNTSSSTATAKIPKAGAGYVRITYLDETNATYTQNQTFEYSYLGSEETFTPLVTGNYSLEVWGAQGGSINSSYLGGYGGYSYGEIELTANETLYINVGGQGSYGSSSIPGGYNGGGIGTGGYCNGTRYAASGGGATHIATSSGVLSSLENDKSSILIVAGGGGGSSSYGAYGSGGSGGGFKGANGQFTLSGHSYSQYATGGTQTSGGIFGNSYALQKNVVSGSFGQGGNLDTRSCSEGSGGGGGYYGGGSALFGTGGGGSGYIGSSRLTNKAMYGYSVPITYGSWINNYLSDPKQTILNVEQDVTYSNLQTALDEVEDGETLQLLDDISITYDLETQENINFTLDMNGYNLDTTKQITNNSNMKIINSTVDSTEEEEIVVETSESIYYYNGTKYNNLYTENTYQVDQATFETNYIDLPNDGSGYYIVYTDTIDLSQYNTIIVKKTNFVGTRAKFAENPNLVGNVGDTISPTWQNISGDIYAADISSYNDGNKKFYIDADSGENAGYVYYIAFSSKTLSEVTEDSSFVDNPTVTYSKAFNYTGNEQVFTAPEDGVYKLESWGASGGDAIWSDSVRYPGGYGGYSTGTISLHKGDKLYINVGGAGTDDCREDCDGGYNGGGIASGSDGAGYGAIYVITAGSGGGATSIATETGLLEDLESKKSSIVLVSGGGGGSLIHRYENAENWWQGYGGSAGGFESTAGAIPVAGRSISPTVATQTTPGTGYSQSSYYGQGSFGKGQDGNLHKDVANCAGAGGGYYGGGASGYTSTSGGSSYINTSVLNNAYMMCYNCTESNTTETKTISTTNTASTPTSEYANEGDGYVLITSINAKENNDQTFNYTGSEEEFTVPVSGIYKLETWGAQGGAAICNNGDCESTPGYGGYAVGEIYLSQGTKLYINVGGKGGKGTLNACSTGGYNGGGTGTNDGGSCGSTEDNEASGGGGGATSIATTSGLLSTLENNKNSILIVSGGGGGASYNYDSGSGGGAFGGITSTTNQTEVSQTTGYAFGQGQNATGAGDSDGVGGGGGGYYGGYSNNVSFKSAGSGGSGYIGNSRLNTKHMACYDCDISSESSSKTISVTDVSETPVANYAKIGDGAAKISFVRTTSTVEFDYTGDVQQFVAPETAKYKIEAWGAQGGSTDLNSGGKGAYTSGIIDLNKDDVIYVYVGATPGDDSRSVAAYNGGGLSSGEPEYSSGGGGATDIRLVSGTWNDQSSLASRIMVAGAGGGAYTYELSNFKFDGGAAGGLEGATGEYSNTCASTGGTQTSGGTCSSNNSTAGSFGQGGNSVGGRASGGGSGYYGGAARYDAPGSGSGAGGGSSYISGYRGSIAITSGSDLTPKTGCTSGTNDIECSYHYSGKIFTNSKMIDGASTMPTHDGTSTMVGNSGDGYAKITKVEASPITEFDYTGDVQEYTVPATGTYKIEAWGAQGASQTDTNGGAYTSGTITLTKDTKLYIYVGEKGNYTRTATFNGGGVGGLSNESNPDDLGNSGGGATDIRLVKGTTWDDSSSLASRIMVAGGSGGGADSLYETAGEYSIAGGLTGGSGGYYSGHSYVGQNGQGGTQTAGGAAGVNHYSASGTNTSGSFGQGGSSQSTSAYKGSGGGGGGYYGGGAGGSTMSGGAGQGGGGGSSYISGYKGSVAITSEQDLTPKSGCSDGTTNVECSYHYSGNVFKNAIMKDGASTMPTHDGTSTMVGNSGDGYVKITFIENDPVTEYGYTGTAQEFTAKKTGKYKIEAWGAQGSSRPDNRSGGPGAYTSGILDLNQGDTLYVYVGGTGASEKNNGAGNTIPYGEYAFNGASGGNYTCYSYNNTTAYNNYGGGATDIRLVSGNWDDSTSLASRIMVAAGGAAANENADGVPGGALTGYDGIHGTGGTQTSAGGPRSGSFGKAGIPVYGGYRCNGSIASGAGSGYYGGGAYDQDRDNNGMGSAGSGSSYISGYKGSVAITSASDTSPKTGCTNGTTDVTCSYHYSGKVFTNTSMRDGASSMPTHDGEGTMTGNEGDGFVKITYIEEKEEVRPVDFDYTGSEQVFTAPKTGTYKLETWGAQGGGPGTINNKVALGGYGGYSTGEITLNAGDTLYINVGGKGTYGRSDPQTGGYNGGGNVSNRHGDSNEVRASGGGATSIATSTGTLYELGQNSKQGDVVIVAGGGGGSHLNSVSSSYSYGGSGGGFIGGGSSGVGDGTYNLNNGGTQLEVGSSSTSWGVSDYGDFGKGASASQNGAGAGGGYYGGGVGVRGSGGGSGYIDTSVLANAKMVMYQTDQGYKSTEPETYTDITSDVNEEAVSDNAKSGDGFARITYVPDNGENITEEVISVTTVTNFTYDSVLNNQYDEMVVSNGKLISTVANSGNASVTYYNNPIRVTTTKVNNMTIMGSIDYYNNKDDNSLGTLYVGLSKTNSNNIDFDYYDEYEIDSTTAKTIDFEFTPDEVGDYYFKIILVHNDSYAYSNIFAELNNLKIRTIKKKSEREYSPSSINNGVSTTLFINNSTLDIENVNFDVYNLVEGTSNSVLTIDGSTIKGDNKAINSSGDITVTNSSIVSPYGIDSKKDLVLSNSSIRSTNQGIINSGTMTITNSSVSGTSYGIYVNSSGNSTVTNSVIKSTSVSVYKQGSGSIDLTNDTMTGSVQNSGASSTLTVTGGSITGQISNSGTSTYSKVPITYTSNYYNAENLINNSGILNMNESEVTFNSTYASGSSYRTSALYNTGTVDSYKTKYNVFHTNGYYKWMIGINNSGLLTSNRDSIEITGAGASYAILNDTSNDCTITNININSHDNGSEIYGIRNLRGKINLNGGSVSMNNNTFTHGLYTSGTSNTIVTDTVFTLTNNSNNSKAIYMQDDGGTVTVVRGTFSASATGEADAIYMDNGTLNIQDGIFNANSTSGTAYGLKMSNGTATIEKGTVSAHGTNAYGIYMTRGTYTQGIPDNSGYETADVSITDPHIEAIGTTEGTGISMGSGSFNFYDGIIIGSTRSRVAGDIVTNTDTNFQVKTDIDENNYSYSILEFIK